MTFRRLISSLLAGLVPVLLSGACSEQLGTGDNETSASHTSVTPSQDPAGDDTQGGPTSGAAPSGAVSEKRSPREPTATAAQPGPSPTGAARTQRRTRPRALVSYVFPVSGCDSTYAATHHDYPAADIFAAGDCAFVAPVAGRITFVSRVDRWDPATNDGADRGGLAVALVGVDGVQYYGSHLAQVDPGIAPGLRVPAGRALGTVGQTGSARGTGAHLHFGISWPTDPAYWWIRRGTVAPQPYLDAWRTGRHRRPTVEVASARREYGDDSHCLAHC